MNRVSSFRRAAAAAAAGGALALVAAGPALAGRAAPPRCATSTTVVWLDTRGDGAAGSVYYKLEFTNLASRACTLVGYPGVSAVDLAGRQLGSAASRNPARRRAVLIAAGATATAVLRIVEAGNYPRAACRQVTAAGLRVYPPNETASRLVPFPFAACSRSGPVYLDVAPVTAR